MTYLKRVKRHNFNDIFKGGGYAEYVANHEDLLMKVPSSLSFTQAAAIPEVWLTAFQLLHEVGKT